MKRFIFALLALSLVISGCAPFRISNTKKYTATYLDLFDTVTTVVGYAQTQNVFQEQAQQIHDALAGYHRLFDIYNSYPGINNLHTVNANAGKGAVKVDGAIIELLKDCRSYYALTDGKVNVAMGSILRLWHDARTYGIENPADAKLPAKDALAAAAQHISFDSVEIDEAASTVFITDPEQSLDVGAIAKGWVTQRVAESAPEGMLISVGGNVYATGPKDADGTAWVIGIQDPCDVNSNLHTIGITGGCVVTSGDYQRVFTVAGKVYHHIIDPQTRMPSEYWRSVSVVCEDSALADALSTALFLLPLEQGQTLAEAYGAQVLWVDADGGEFMTPGFAQMIRE